MYERPEEVLNDWLGYVNSGDLEGVLSLYSNDAVLLPTFSSETRNSLESIRGYFVMVSSNNEGAKVELIPGTLVIQDISEKVFSLSGLYSWEIITEGVERKAMARFTYTVDIRSSSPIKHHHSSLVPEE